VEANKRTLGVVFERSCRYVVPLFQRPYVWTEENQWRPLWEDIRRLAVTRANGNPDPQHHFLGAVVLDQVFTSTGVVETRQVIDGQQRLTTLQLVIAAVRDLAQALGAERDQAAVADLSRNQHAYIDDKSEEFKVWPTNQDRSSFSTVLSAGSVDTVRETFEVDGNPWYSGDRIADCYLFFYREAAQWVGDDVSRLKHLILTLRNAFQLVVIDLEPKDDAQVIFETLNARGQPLLPTDLVKNHLFLRAERDKDDVEALYTEHWAQFDEPFWRQEVKQGRLKRPRVDLFLQHYLAHQNKKEVLISQLFTTCKAFIQNEGISAADHLSRIAHFARIYRSFAEFTRDTLDGVFFYHLGILDVSTLYPFLLQVYDKLGGEEYIDERHAVLSMLNSYLIRRLACGLTTKNYNKVFLDLLAETADGVDAASVRAYLERQTADSSRWPTDDDLKSAVHSHPLYAWMTRGRLRMLLEALDEQVRSNKAEPYQIKTKLTIEHLLPQSWQEHWPLAEPEGTEQYEQAAARREQLMHTLGNLTLVTKRLNPAMSNSPWEKKRPELLAHSAINLNRYFQEVERWDEVAIVKRAELLFEAAKKIWPGPKVEQAAVQEEPVEPTVTPDPRPIAAAKLEELITAWALVRIDPLVLVKIDPP
jgi:hypothetical protein